MNNINLQACKYNMNDINVLFSDGSKQTIPAMNVYFFSIEKDYFESFMPIFNIKCLVTSEMYSKINKDDKAKFRIDIEKFFINSNTVEMNKKNGMTKPFITNTFINLNVGDETPDIAQTISNRKDDKKADKRNEYEKSQIELDLFLVTENYNDYTIIGNKIFTECTMYEVLIALNQMTLKSKMLLTVPSNKTKYNSYVLIPKNLTFIGAIEYLQEVYGIYSYGMLVFKDFDILYILDKNIVCNAYKRFENKKVIVHYNDMTNSQQHYSGSYEDMNSHNYHIYCKSAPDLQNGETEQNALLGTELVTTNSSENNTGARMIEDKYNNKYAVSSYKYERSLKRRLVADFDEVDLDILTPNKLYYFDFNISGSKVPIKGEYKLASLMIICEKTDDKVFSNKVRGVFARV